MEIFNYIDSIPSKIQQNEKNAYITKHDVAMLSFVYLIPTFFGGSARALKLNIKRWCGEIYPRLGTIALHD